MKVRLLRGRVAIREYQPKKIGSILVPDDYYDKNEREETSHRGRVLAMGPPARTILGVEIQPDFWVGDDVLFIFDMPNADNIEGSGATEQMRTGIWPEDGGPVVYVAQEEVIGLYEPNKSELFEPGYDDTADEPRDQIKTVIGDTPDAIDLTIDHDD